MIYKLSLAIYWTAVMHTLFISPSVNEQFHKNLILNTCISAFDRFEADFPSSEWISKQAGGVLAWHESRRLMAYVSMFEGTGNVKYLNAVMKRINEVLKIRDDKKK